MENIVILKLSEWAKGLTPEEAKIRIFEKIRDIPYAIVPEFFSLEKGPGKMLKQNRGFCVPKHYLLGMMYQRMDTPVRYCVYPFKWNGLGIEYPSGLKKLADDIPVTYHLACKASIEDKWVLVDATWDPALKGAGFPVNGDWDGRSSMTNAVKPLDEFIHEDAHETDKMLKEKLAAYSLPEKLALSRFSGGFNSWLEEARLGPLGCSP